MFVPRQTPEIAPSADRPKRVNAAGWPEHGRGRQAAIALAVVVSWIGVVILVLWAHQGGDPAQPARLLGGLGLLTWAASEMAGGRDGPIWPVSALGVTGSLSIGYAAGLLARDWAGQTDVGGIAVICGVSAVTMLAFLLRFRLPGLVSPVVTFAVVALFLALYGLDRDGLARVEGLSARGILAALTTSPWAAAAFGVLGAAAVALARRLDLKGDDFCVASARPLHLIGAGVGALVAGRVLAALPGPVDAAALLALWAGAWVWALRINRVAVLVAIHFAIAKPAVVAVGTPFGWQPGMEVWSALLTSALLADMAAWPLAHRVAQARGWILGPGGRVPPARAGWTWRYWPYA